MVTRKFCSTRSRAITSSLLMQSDLPGPANVDCPKYVTVRELIGDCGQDLRARGSKRNAWNGQWACNRGFQQRPDLFISQISIVPPPATEVRFKTPPVLGSVDGPIGVPRF